MYSPPCHTSAVRHSPALSVKPSLCKQSRHLPPCRTSTVRFSASNCRGPNHCFICSGSVQAFHTNSRGASNTRVMFSSCCVLTFGDTVAVPIAFLLVFLNPHHLARRIEHARQHNLPFSAAFCRFHYFFRHLVSPLSVRSSSTRPIDRNSPPRTGDTRPTSPQPASTAPPSTCKAATAPPAH